MDNETESILHTLLMTELKLCTILAVVHHLERIVRLQFGSWNISNAHSRIMTEF